MARPGPVTRIERQASDRDVIPLYHRIYVVLLQKIDDGSYPSGASIPSEDDLAQTYGVSRVTIRKAMDRLEREGRVQRQRGRGTFPLAPAAGHKRSGHPLLKDQVSLAQKTKVAVLDYGLVRMPAGMAELFEAPRDGELLRIVRVRADHRSPISHTICHLPADLAHLIPRSAMSSLPVSATLAQAGVKLARFEEKVTAILADIDLAGHLDVEFGAPLVAMTRMVRDESGRVVELLQAHYRTDRYEYRVDYSIDDYALGARWKAMITDSA
ncbi:MAG: GntR family transcriptional regulator [Methylobacteriaceae bacterium]|nr:GntR family transcriptional regulator [Methylobacteriaceae bacterium]